MSRALHLLRGAPAETEAAALRAVADLPPGEALWLGPAPALPPADLPPALTLAPRGPGPHLGRAFSAVVLSQHAGLDLDLLLAAGGFLPTGGALLLRLPPPGAAPPAPGLEVPPWPAAAVGRRAWDRLERLLAASPAVGPLAPLRPAAASSRGNPDQDAVVDALVGVLRARGAAALLAPRGRGKSAALGRALAAAGPRRVALIAEDPAALIELRRFAGPGPAPLSPAEALAAAPGLDALVVDEAARLPVPLLRQLCRAAPQAALLFATTSDGYEGTGRGFRHRFLPWLAAERPGLLRPGPLTAPLRWAPGCPLEALLAELLLLPAPGPPPPFPAPVTLSASAPAAGGPLSASVETVDRDRLAADPPLLRAVFSLLCEAHYRTVPGDLHRLLDAPNVDVHLRWSGGALVGANLSAREGELPPALAAALGQGATRLRGQALAETLASHAGRPEAAAWPLVRSLRLAVDPAAGGQGHAGALIEHLHARPAPPALWGTLFGATPALLRLRARHGYRLARLGGGPGAVSGEPAALMLRPNRPEAAALVDDLQRELRWALPAWRALVEAEAGLPLDPALVAEVEARVPPARPPTPAEVTAALAGWLRGPRPYEAVAWAAEAALDLGHPVDPRLAPLVEARVRRRRRWSEAAAAGGLGSVPAAMRALKRAFGGG